MNRVPLLPSHEVTENDCVLFNAYQRETYDASAKDDDVETRNRVFHEKLFSLRRPIKRLLVIDAVNNVSASHALSCHADTLELLVSVSHSVWRPTYVKIGEVDVRCFAALDLVKREHDFDGLMLDTCSTFLHIIPMFRYAFSLLTKTRRSILQVTYCKARRGAPTAKVVAQSRAHQDTVKLIEDFGFYESSSFRNVDQWMVAFFCYVAQIRYRRKLKLVDGAFKNRNMSTVTFLVGRKE